MKFAICNETFQDWPLEQAFAFARQCGYTGIEIAPFTLNTYAYKITPEQRQQVRRAAEENGLEIIGLHWLLAHTDDYYLTSPDPRTRQKTAAYFEELARLCRDLGGRLLVLGSPKQRNLLPGVTEEVAVDCAADCLLNAAPAFERHDVVLAVEPLGPEEGNFLLTAESAVELIERVNSPNVRLHLDVKAMSTEVEPIEEVIRRFAPWLVHFHANDPNKRGPGMGKVDFVPILRTLQEINYQGWVSVEVFDYTPGPEALARESIDYLQRCLAEVRA